MNFTHLDRFLQEHADRLGIPGLSCAVMKDGKLVYQTFQGAADLESGRPIREDTVFRIYSMTKLICVRFSTLFFSYSALPVKAI